MPLTFGRKTGARDSAAALISRVTERLSGRSYKTQRASVSEPPSLWRLKDRRSALSRPLCLLLFGFLCTSRRGRGCCLRACVTGRYGPARSRRADLARSADAGWAARALTRGALLSQDRCAEEPDGGSEKKSLFHVRHPGLVLTGRCMNSPRRSRAQHHSDAPWPEREAEAQVPEWDRGVRQHAGSCAREYAQFS